VSGGDAKTSGSLFPRWVVVIGGDAARIQGLKIEKLDKPLRLGAAGSATHLVHFLTAGFDPGTPCRLACHGCVNSADLFPGSDRRPD